jgi:hypothetical protein
MMERLTEEQRKAISKLTIARLAVKLSQIGVSESEIEAMNKDAMMHAWALAVFDGRDKPEAAAEGKSEVASAGPDVDLEKKRLEFEMRKWEEERKLKEKEMDLKRLEIERMEQWRKDKMKATLDQREEERRQLERRAKEERERLNSPVYKAKLFGEALRGTMARMPSDALDLIPWLRNVEKLFVDFHVSDDLKVHLLKPHLTEQARNLLARMDPGEAAKYEAVKRVLLHEFKLSSAALLERFNGLARNPNETFTLYSNRLKSVLTYYIESRDAGTYDLLVELLICDRVKSQLSDGALRHILSIENQTDIGWFPS